MIPIMRPKLPPARKLAKYLKQIDANHWFSNSGPLLKEYEARLADRFKAPVVATSSGTSALTAAIIALELPKGSHIACPSYTFVATPAAIVAAGHVPFFCDVDTDGYMVMDQPRVQAIVVVAPFGKGIEAFRGPKSDIPMIVDAAAGFDSMQDAVHDIPVVFSTHCTKVMGTGEGGFLACTDTDFLAKVHTIINQGIDPYRAVPFTGINGKMSEYHAAVGMAELDGWEAKREKWKRVQHWYKDTSPHVTSTHLVSVPDAAEAKKMLAAKGIDTRVSWYGCANLAAYKDFPRTELPVTEHLMRTQLALPKYIGMSQEDVEYILEALKGCVLQ